MQDNVEDEVQPGYTDAPEFEYSSAPVPGHIDEEGHINAGDLWGVQTKTFFIDIPEGATLEQLEARHKNGVFWQMPAEQKNFLKQINKATNRSVVSEKDLDGDLTKALFLSAKIVAFHNDSAKSIAVDIPGLLPTGHTSTDRHTYVLRPTGGNLVVINKSIFQPENLFTRFMYEHNQKCNLKTLAQQIRLDYDPKKQIATMDSRGVGWKVLLDNLKSEDSPFISALDSIYAKNQHIIENPDPERSQIAEVPYEIASQVFNAIAKPLKEIEKSYQNFASWKVRFSPANKQPWNSIAGLAQEGVVFGHDAISDERDHKLNTPISAGLEVEISYVLDN